MTQHYCDRKNGTEEVADLHPSLKDILGKTYGILTYQEQSMRIAKELAGFSPLDVDVLRKSIGKKDQKLLAEQGKKFIEGCKTSGVVGEEVAATVWGWIKATGRYQFNSSHSMSYGIRGYKTAFVKAHFPLAFFAAWLLGARHKSDPREEMCELVNEARLFDVDVTPPDFLALKKGVHVDGKKVRLGLCDVKSVGEPAIDKLLAAVPGAEASAGKPAREWRWWEFLAYLSDEASYSVVVKLAQAGAFRSLGAGRQRAVAEYEAFARLTGKESDWLRQQRGQFASLEQALIALCLPTYRKPQEKRWRTAKPGHEARVAELEVVMAELEETHDGESDAVKLELRGVKKEHRKLTVLHKEMPPEPVGPFGGCSSEERRDFVRSLAALLQNPPSPLADGPHWVAQQEENLLGVSLSCSRVDGCEVAAVNASCKDVVSGRAGNLVIGVEVRGVREIKTKNGKNPGARMAFASVTDGTCPLEVVLFPEVWAESSTLFSVDNVLIVLGERDRDRGSLIAAKVWQAARAAGSIDSHLFLEQA